MRWGWGSKDSLPERDFFDDYCAVHLQAVAGDHSGRGGGEEQRRLVMEAWGHQTGSSPV